MFYFKTFDVEHFYKIIETVRCDKMFITQVNLRFMKGFITNAIIILQGISQNTDIIKDDLILNSHLRFPSTSQTSLTEVNTTIVRKRSKRLQREVKYKTINGISSVYN